MEVPGQLADLFSMDAAVLNCRMQQKRGQGTAQVLNFGRSHNAIDLKTDSQHLNETESWKVSMFGTATNGQPHIRLDLDGPLTRSVIGMVSSIQLEGSVTASGEFLGSCHWFRECVSVSRTLTSLF